MREKRERLEPSRDVSPFPPASDLIRYEFWAATTATTTNNTVVPLAGLFLLQPFSFLSLLRPRSSERERESVCVSGRLCLVMKWKTDRET